MNYHFYGWENADVSAISDEYFGIKDPYDLYDAFLKIWKEDTCAPRMADKWKDSHPSLGQCSISAFLVQDIFGGEVYGVRLEDGSIHCFNVVDSHLFDLSSEQFDEILDYSHALLQEREKHFSKEEKYHRYLLLKERLKDYCKTKDTD